MVATHYKIREDYWDTFELNESDIEYLYNYLLEQERPQTLQHLVKALVAQRIETEKKISPDEVRNLLQQSPGVALLDDLLPDSPQGDKNARSYPTTLDVNEYRDQVLVGRIRKDTSSENGIALWCVADNLRKGAALNIVQIAEELVKKGILSTR